MKFGLKNFILVILLFSVAATTYTNCSDINLKSKAVKQNIEQAPPVTPPTTPPVTPPPDDPIGDTILPVAPTPQFSPLSNPGNSCAVTPDSVNRASLNFYSLSANPISCPAPNYKIVKSYTYTNGAEDTGACKPTSTTELAEPSLVNMPPGNPSLVLMHQIWFLRPDYREVYSFRIRTPPSPISLRLNIYSMYSTTLTYSMLGCSGSTDCGNINDHISVTKDPCDFTFQKSSCRFDQSAKSFNVKNAPVNMNNCELETNSIYYVNINFAKPRLCTTNPATGVCEYTYDGYTSRMALDIIAP